MTVKERISEIKASNTYIPEYICKLCKDSLYVYDKETGTATECKCKRIKDAERLIRQSELAFSSTTQGFKNFRTNGIEQLIKAKDTCIEYIRAFEGIEHNRDSSISLFGQVGAGKTHLATAISRTLIDRGIKVLYMNYRQVSTKLKQLITDSDEYTAEIDKYKLARVLFIDDLLKGKYTESDVNLLFEIVNYRYLNNLPMIITSELTIDKILAFDEAVGSRIIEMSKSHTIILYGEELNYRLR